MYTWAVCQAVEHFGCVWEICFELRITWTSKNTHAPQLAPEMYQLLGTTQAPVSKPEDNTRAVGVAK